MRLVLACLRRRFGPLPDHPPAAGTVITEWEHVAGVGPDDPGVQAGDGEPGLLGGVQGVGDSGEETGTFAHGVRL